MTAVVVPFRSSDPKSRLEGLSDRDRAQLAAAMLHDVLDAAAPLGRLLVVADDAEAVPPEARHVADPRRGQGAAVRAGLDAAAAEGETGPFLVVNADLPCATTRDLLALVGAMPDGGLALVAAADGTTNALALSGEDLFEPLYGPGSAARFEALAPSLRLDAPNLVDDVDTLDDLRRLRGRLGRRTRGLLAALRLEPAA